MKLHPGYEKRPDDPRFVDCVKTPLTEEEATYYLRTAWKNVLGTEPTIDSLALLWAKSRGETGSWKFLRCNNWGNIKKKPQWKYTSYDAGEILKGKHQMFYPYHPQTFFAAWDTPLEGAEAYIDFLANPKSRYHKAWEIVVTTGDPVTYTYELHKAGYFTAKLDKYTEGMVWLTDQFKSKADRLMAWEPPEPEPVPEPEPEPEPEEEVDLSELEEEDNEPVEITPPPTIEEPEEKITDLIPEPVTGETKLHFIARWFYTLWGYLVQALAYFKKK